LDQIFGLGFSFGTADACFVEMDIFAKTNRIGFDYVFGSEEYELDFSPFSDDLIAVLISGPGVPGLPGLNGQLNLAWVPGTNNTSLVQIQRVNATITDIKFKYNVNTFEHLSTQDLSLNDIGEVTLSLDKAVAFETYDKCKPMGAFVLIDRYSHSTVGAGMINFALRRAQNVHRQALVIDKKARAKLNGHPGRVLWFTGLSGSGKSTIANALEQVLHERGIRTYILAGDTIRHGLNKDLGFTDADRVENIRRVAEVARLMADAGIVVLTSFISPFRSERDMARSLFEPSEFVEIYVNVSLEVAEARDVKGLYKKARRGELPNFTGIDSDYEIPENAEIDLAAADLTIDQCVEQILKYI